MDTGRLPDRAEAWTRRHPLRVGRLNAGQLAVRVARRAVAVRVTGLAAEMTYYALLSLVPLLLALGSTLGFLERLLGADQVARLEEALVAGLRTVFSPQLTGDVLAPLVRGLLSAERAGLAFGSLLVSLWLAGRVFRAAVRTLDDAYDVPDRRRVLSQTLLAYLFSLGAVVTITIVLALLVIGPLLGGGRQLAEMLGLGGAFETAWAVGRWPAVLMVTGGFLTLLYRVGPAVDNGWRDCLPGAVVGVIGIVAVTVGMRAYLAVTGPSVPELADADAALALVAQAVGAVLAVVLWAWLASIAVLTGGVVNAELARARREEV